MNKKTFVELLEKYTNAVVRVEADRFNGICSESQFKKDAKIKADLLREIVEVGDLLEDQV